MKRHLIISTVYLLACAFVHADEAVFTLMGKKPQQGSMIILQTKGDAEFYYQQKKLNKTSHGLVVFGVGRDAPETVYIEVKTAKQQKKYPISIKQRQWKTERIDGLPQEKVSPQSAQVLARIKQEILLVKKARETEFNLNHFSEKFILPVSGRISGVYGSQRILNGVPKRPHYGIDIANKQGTEIVAPASGVVTLVHADMFYSGGTLIIDHGFGISSTFIHLQQIKVKQGQQVKQGEVIATLGATGRATGPHLDWRINWFQTRLDPQLLVDFTSMQH